MAALISRVVWGTGPTAVAVDTYTGGEGLSASVGRAREPVLIYDGAGDPHYVLGPGADRVQVSVSGQGRRVPSLAGQASTGLVTTISWSDGTTTVLSVTSIGIAERQSDLLAGLTGWTWTGIGTVTSGTDPLGR